MEKLDKNQMLEEFTSCDWKKALLDFQRQAYIASHIPENINIEVKKRSFIRLLQYTFVLSIPTLYIYSLPSIDGYKVNSHNMGDFIILVGLFGFAFTYHLVKDKIRYSQGATYTTSFFCKNMLLSKDFLQKHIDKFAPHHHLSADDLLLFFDKVVYDSLHKNKDALAKSLETLELNKNDLEKKPESNDSELLSIKAQQSEIRRKKSLFTYIQDSFQDEKSKLTTLRFFLKKFHGNLKPLSCDSKDKLERLNKIFVNTHRH